MAQNGSDNMDALFVDYDETERTLSMALPLVGWSNEIRILSEDKMRLLPICVDLLDREENGTLTSETMDKYAAETYEIIKHQLFDPIERADAAGTRYYYCNRIRPLLPLIDEATISYFRGYDRAAMSLLFIAVESYLRALSEWTPSQGDIAFKRLKQSISSLPQKRYAANARKIIDAIYGRYDSMNPSQFYFNRHGLLHGLHGSTEYDEMNVGRLFLLFDTLCKAEGVDRIGWGEGLTMTNYRIGIYSKCKENAEEKLMLALRY